MSWMLKYTVLLIVLSSGVTQDCLQPADSQDRQIPFRDDNSSPRLPSGTQAIITSYQFHCCGNITEWQTYVQPGGGRHRDGSYTIYFQVWRPSPTVNTNGCYSQVGENRFENIILGDGGLVRETPQPSNIITFQPGDVVGYFTLSENGGNEGIQLDTTYNDDTVWYNGGDLVTGGSLECPYPVGSNMILSASTNAAPVLSVSINTCTTSQSIASPSPSITYPSPTTSPLPIYPSPTTITTSTTTYPSPTNITASLPPVKVVSDSNLSPIIIGTVSGAAVLVTSLAILAISVAVFITARKYMQLSIKLQTRNNIPLTTNASYATTAHWSVSAEVDNTVNEEACNLSPSSDYSYAYYTTIPPSRNADPK